MKSRLVLSSLMLLLLTGSVFALCTTGSTATCSINGKPGTRTCLGSGRFGPCVASPQTNPPLFTRFANTFLRKLWHYDYQNASGIRIQYLYRAPP
jgi:hypothetical protein